MALLVVCGLHPEDKLPYHAEDQHSKHNIGHAVLFNMNETQRRSYERLAYSSSAAFYPNDKVLYEIGSLKQSYFSEGCCVKQGENSVHYEVKEGLMS